MSDTKLTEYEKQLLRRIAHKFENEIFALSRDDKAILKSSCEKLNTKNCWYMCYYLKEATLDALPRSGTTDWGPY